MVSGVVCLLSVVIGGEVRDVCMVPLFLLTLHAFCDPRGFIFLWEGVLVSAIIDAY